ncbi:MAG: FAD:protein FMN transferase [Prevotella sp.]|nr:FAD:protein FMN transferase [Prevotella sp.]
MCKKQQHISYWQIIVLILLIIGSIYIICSHKNSPYQKDDGVIFGTTYHIIYQNDRKLTNEIEAIFAAIDESLSPFNKNSIITKVNNNIPVNLNDYFIDVFNFSMRIAKLTNGAFDPTVAPLVNAWGFGFKENQEVSPKSIDSLRHIVGYQNISIKANKVVKQNPKITLDFSAIAKGYACDVIANMFKENNISNFMIEVGGEIVAHGVNPNNDKWNIGIASPIDNNESIDNSYQAVISISDNALATSGNYRNFYYKNRKKFAHTIDPKTGYPVQHSLLSATVIAPTCAIADAYATSFMVMGMDKAKHILNKHKELKAYFIYTDENGNNKTWFSQSLKDVIN